MNPPKPDGRSRLFALEQFGIKLGLEQIRSLVTALDRPDLAFPSLIVAGTNGKGSVTAMLERGLGAAGYRTGRYTSPHLVDLEERFAINGTSVEPATLDAALDRVLVAADTLALPPTFFESTTALAFELFREASVDIAVLEVGLGGRLDATNVVTPMAAAITAIDMDHEQYLGDTLAAIAREKAGVIKPGIPVVLAENPVEVETVVREVCIEMGARFIRAADGVECPAEMRDGRAHVVLATPERRYAPMTLALRGRHQIANAVTAVRLLEVVSSAGRFSIAESAVRAAVENVTWPGRLEILRARGPDKLDGLDVLIDGAHNPAGARALAAFVHETYGRRLPMVVGVMRDKNIDALLSALAASASAFVFTAPSSPRAATPEELVAVAARVAPDVPAITTRDPLAAVTRAAALGSPVVVGGSLYLAGEIRAGLA